MINVNRPGKGIRDWITIVKKVFNHSPAGVWFFVADSQLHIMAYGLDGGRVMTEDGRVDQDYIIDSIPVDDIYGGDW